MRLVVKTLTVILLWPDFARFQWEVIRNSFVPCGLLFCSPDGRAGRPVGWGEEVIHFQPHPDTCSSVICTCLASTYPLRCGLALHVTLGWVVEGRGCWKLNGGICFSVFPLFVYPGEKLKAFSLDCLEGRSSHRVKKVRLNEIFNNNTIWSLYGYILQATCSYVKGFFVILLFYFIFFNQVQLYC